MQLTYQEIRTTDAPSQGISGYPPRNSHTLITGGNRGKKCWDLKSNVRTPKHVSTPHRGGHPRYFSFSEARQRGFSHNHLCGTGEVASSLLEKQWGESSALDEATFAGGQTSGAQGPRRSGTWAAGRGLVSEPHSAERLRQPQPLGAGFGVWSAQQQTALQCATAAAIFILAMSPRAPLPCSTPRTSIKEQLRG